MCAAKNAIATTAAIYVEVPATPITKLVTIIAKTGVKVSAAVRGADHVGLPFKPHCIGKRAAVGNLRPATTEDRMIAKMTEAQTA